jgi:hypothetical protein
MATSAEEPSQCRFAAWDTGLLAATPSWVR